MRSDHSFWPWHEFGMFPGFFFLLVIIIVFFVARSVGRSSTQNSPAYFKNKPNDQTPMVILKIRLAKGEIDQEEFDKIKKTLSE